jgi:hypothetical protein
MKRQDDKGVPEGPKELKASATSSGNLTTTYMLALALAITVLYIALSNYFPTPRNYLRITVLTICLLVVFFLKPKRGNEARSKYGMRLLFNFILLFSSVAGLSSIASSFQKSIKNYLAAKNNTSADSVVGYLIPGKPLLGISSRRFENEINKKQSIITEKNHGLVQAFWAIEALSFMKKEAHVNGVSWMFYGKKRPSDSGWLVRNFSVYGAGADSNYIPAKGDKLRAKKEIAKMSAIVIDSAYSQQNHAESLLEKNTVVEVVEVVRVLDDGYWILAAEESGM